MRTSRRQTIATHPLEDEVKMANLILLEEGITRANYDPQTISDLEHTYMVR